jgi:hypothetical protein
VGGFLAGSLVLIALAALVQRGSATGITAGGKALTGMVHRFLSADVPGVPVVGSVRGSIGKAIGDAGGVLKLGGKK